MHNAEWCFQHNPATRLHADAARFLGGKRRKRPAPAPSEPTRLRTVEDALAELEALADDAKALHHGADRIRVLATVIRTAIDAIADHAIEQRLAALEARAGAPTLRRA